MSEDWAILNRRRSKPWKFVWCDMYLQYVHTTSRGTRYVIMEDFGPVGKPVWIARVVDHKACTCERELRAESIDFKGGGKYIFPR